MHVCAKYAPQTRKHEKREAYKDRNVQALHLKKSTKVEVREIYTQNNLF